jgi:Carboxypeptidase regulatory-like domain
MKRWILFAGLLLCAASMAAQSSTGSVYGAVVDPRGLAVAGAKITVRSTDLASARSTVSNGSGAFSLAGLVPGAYTVEAAKNPLKLKRPIRLTVGLGSSTQVAIKLDIAEVKQRSTVTARGATSEGNTTTPPINQSEASISTFLAGTVVTYLPNRDRDVAQFNQLASNAHESEDGDGVSIDGQRTNALLTQVDGVDFNSPLFGASTGAENRSFFLPQTVIREFQIVSSGVSSEVGQTSAGLINVATKEGSNKLHGEAFYTVRPSPLTSADTFGNSPSNLMNNFGASEGGALRKNRSFFYAGFEQDFLHAPTFTQFAPQAPGTIIPSSLTELRGQIDERDSPLALSGRIDQILNSANTVNIELAGSRIRTSSFGNGETRTLATTSASGHESGQSLFGRVGLTTVLNAHTVNQALVAYTSVHNGYTPNSIAPQFFINGFGILGGNTLGPHLYTAQQLQLGDGVSISRGTALFTFGGEFSNDPLYEQREENLNGRFDYNSLTNYLAHQPRRFQQTFVTGPTRFTGTLREFGIYGNGRVDLHPGLTLTAGVRWAAQWNPQPMHPNAAISQTQKIPNDLSQWQPRAGLVWSVTKKTVVRLSSGLYNAATPATIFHRVFVDNGTQTVTADSYFDPALLTLTNATTAAPIALSAVPIGLTTPHALIEGIDAGFRNPTSFQAALSVDQTISPKLTMRAGYLHAATWHLQRALDENLAPPTINAQGVPLFLSPRPLAGVGSLLVNQSNAHSSYDGLSLSAIAQISRRTQVTANYTLSQTHDDNSNDGPYSINAGLNPFAPKTERAFSNLDIRNVLNVAGIFNLPAGFKLNPLIVVRSGAPYTGLIGFDTQNDANDFNDRALTNGVETPRNLYRGPTFSDADLRLVKDFTLKGEGHHLDLFMDVFNVLGTSNRNFGDQQVSLFGNATNPIFSARQALFAPGVTRVGGPREFQFTARLVGF